jgi:DNA ligase D-like protein (predicted ligase)/DNA ligase D-like protein (predicted 3'-phosphoesterase)
MADKLGKYRDLRDFEASSEPEGERAASTSRRDSERRAGTPDGDSPPRFVVQEHHARSLHWDLRLERDGVLASWAIPRGIPTDPKRNHLAVHVEDHPLDYLDFEGEIPKGEYGAGTIRIWDRGTYEPHKFRADEVIATFRGKRLRGKYALFQTDGDNWMIHRMDPADPASEPMPERVAPMMARLSALPSDDAGWGYEIKWDGVRAVLYSEGGRARLTNRNLRDISARYPEVRALGRALGSQQVVLDGEVVALDEGGRPSFERLQRRMHVESESGVRRVAKAVPVVYMVFDLLYLDGRSTMGLAYEERRRLLEGLELSGPHWQVPAYHAGEGKALLEATREQGLEGIVAKRLESPYEPGRRSRYWLKIKNHQRQEFVIGGWLPGKGARAGRLGSLAVGYYDFTAAEARRRGDPQRLMYAGNVGTGFKQADLERLARALEPLRRDQSPFEGRQPPKETVFVEPRLVAEVEFREWTRTRTLRAPSFKGLRDDKDPQDVVMESVAAHGEAQ